MYQISIWELCQNWIYLYLFKIKMPLWECQKPINFAKQLMYCKAGFSSPSLLSWMFLKLSYLAFFDWNILIFNIPLLNRNIKKMLVEFFHFAGSIWASFFGNPIWKHPVFTVVHSELVLSNACLLRRLKWKKVWT